VTRSGTLNQWSSRSNGVMRSDRLAEKTGGGIQDGLQLVLQLAGDSSENRVAVVHLADNQCTNQGQQGMS